MRRGGWEGDQVSGAESREVRHEEAGGGGRGRWIKDNSKRKLVFVRI